MTADIKTPLGPIGRRRYIEGLTSAIRETLLSVGFEERLSLITLVLDLVMPNDQEELARCFAVIEARDKEGQPELPL